MLKNLQHFLKDFSPNGEKRQFTKFTKNNFRKDSFDFVHLIQNWNEIVGEQLGQNTVPLKLRGDLLIVLTNHPNYSQELEFIKNPILVKICEQFPSLNGKIKNIQFQFNSSHFDKQLSLKNLPQIKSEELKRKENKYSPDYQKKISEAQKVFSDVDDIEMKEMLVAIYLQQSETDNTH